MPFQTSTDSAAKHNSSTPTQNATQHIIDITPQHPFLTFNFAQNQNLDSDPFTLQEIMSLYSEFENVCNEDIYTFSLFSSVQRGNEEKYFSIANQFLPIFDGVEKHLKINFLQLIHLSAKHENVNRVLCSRIYHFSLKMGKIKNFKIHLTKYLDPDFIVSLLVCNYIQGQAFVQNLLSMMSNTDSPLYLFMNVMEFIFQFTIQQRHNNLKTLLLRFRDYYALNQRLQGQLEMYVRELRILLLDLLGIKITFRKELSREEVEILDLQVQMIKTFVSGMLRIYEESKKIRIVQHPRFSFEGSFLI